MLHQIYFYTIQDKPRVKYIDNQLFNE